MGFIGKFFLVVMVLSFAEFYLLMFAAEHMGLLATLAMCILTGVVGGGLVRAQGLQTLAKVNQELRTGKMPAATIVSGLILLVIGTMLLTPGFITDTFAFLLLIPPVRQIFSTWLVARFGDSIRKRTVTFGGQGFSQRQNTTRSNAHVNPDDIVIEVEATEVEDNEPVRELGPDPSR